MMVRALVSFMARIQGNTLPVRAGQLIDMPPGVDWLTAGLVAPAPAAAVAVEETELATADHAAERAVAARPPRRKASPEDASS